jgi:hypothetical protein
MARNATNGVLSGSLDTLQENLALVGAFIAVFGVAGVGQFLSPVTILGMMDGGTGLFSTGGLFFDFTIDATTYVVTYAMGLSVIGGIIAYVADPATGELTSNLNKLTPSEISARASDAAAEVIAATYFLGLPAIKIFDLFGIWSNYAGTVAFSAGTLVVGAVCAFVVVYID